MRVVLIALALACAAEPAQARLPRHQRPLPEAMATAPVERAIENVERDTQLSQAQRERVLGRLHLIAYAQRRAPMTRYSNGEWQPAGRGPCGDVAYYPDLTAASECPSGDRAPEPAGLELPALSPVNLNRRALRHLRLARDHYQRSLALEDRDLRARLGLAYVLDELGDPEAARIHLRRLAIAGNEWFSVGGFDSTWDQISVLREAIDHLSDLAISDDDRLLIERLRENLVDARPAIIVTPIVVPLADAPFAQLIDERSSVAFDFAGTGDTRAQGWLTPDAAWLVWDPQHRGEVRSGFDMIGQRTWAVFWSDGFEAMRSLDDNRDGELAGAELEGLALWRDADSDGVSDPGEVLPLAAHGVAGLSVRGAHQRPDLIVAPAGVHLEDGRTRPLYDWTPGLSPAPNS